MIKQVVLKEGKEGDFRATVRLKQDELFEGKAKRDGDNVEVQIPTGIPSEDYNVTVTLHDDGQTIMGRLIHGKFELS